MQRQSTTRDNPLSAPFTGPIMSLDIAGGYSQHWWANGFDRTLAAYIGVDCDPRWERALLPIDITFPIFVSYELHGNSAEHTTGVAPKDAYSIRVNSRVQYLSGEMKHPLDLGYIAPASHNGDLGDTDVKSRLGCPFDRDALTFIYQTAL